MSSLPPMKIVLIEDSPDLCDIWAELLGLDGHQVRAFFDGHSLLEDAAAIHWCDVVVTDYCLPDINGLELVERVRAMRGMLPVVLLSGMRDSSVIKVIQKMPHAVFVPKPADADELDAALGRLVAV
ncbi:MAG TPA: response regulator [Steroidobacteraceae bacterium]|nr:response regulator [Steroidobacteraceae bacterium]